MACSVTMRGDISPWEFDQWVRGELGIVRTPSGYPCCTVRHGKQPLCGDCRKRQWCKAKVAGHILVA